MTREELKEHCKKQIEMCEAWAEARGENPCGKIYEEHKLILELLEQQPCEDAELVSIRQELLERGDEVVSFRHLVERFEGVEKEYKGVPWNLKQIYNNFNILIGEEPCDDCISRDEAIRVAEQGQIQGYEWQFKKLCNLPYVTPQQKTGRWNRVTDKAGHCVWECDKCGWQQRFNTNYCPDCGAKKQEEEENDD